MKVVFLDRDGVINENRPDHVKSWQEFVFLPGALDALGFLREAGWFTIVITNQAIIHRNIVLRETVDEINHRMTQEVARSGGRLDAVLICPHRAKEGCGCRKPRPGLLLQAADRFGLRLDQCYLIGDALTDIAAGQAVGCFCVMVRTGRGRQQLVGREADRSSGYQIAADLSSAAHWITEVEQMRTSYQAWLQVPRGLLPASPVRDPAQAADVYEH
ncbi:MAG: HAD-IIIA family hydrolase [Ardenticatenaceae bacterium]|nr:HAD-IIIA family hydrolase [Ardenticatenaceae bacterium]HBY96844.1 histidinol phosphate phosphatase [Chloroflexota bacterium]